MPQYFNFENLIRKYSTTFTAIISGEGHYNSSGVWEAGEEKEITLQGAIINHRLNKVFRSEGTISTQDKSLYMLEPLEKDLQGAKIGYKGNVYRIGDLLENSEFTGVWNYNLQYISAFDKAGDDSD